MKKNFLFAVRNMNIGGVEKSLISLLNSLNPDDYDIDVLLLENHGGFLEDIPSWVRVISWDGYADIRDEVNLPPLVMIKSLFKSGKVLRAFRLLTGFLSYRISKNIIHYYKAVFKGSGITGLKNHYDIAVSYTSIIAYLSYVVLNYVSAGQYYGWIHFDVNQLVIEKKSQYALHNRFDKIFVVSKKALQSFVSLFPELKEKCELKYNILDEKTINKLSKEKVTRLRNNGEIIIVTLGRLTKEKGQDIVPDIALELKKANLCFKWVLIGDGSLREVIKVKAAQYGLSNEIELIGTQKNPYPYLKQADIYVQTSVHEGYCITLAEARFFDLNIISTKFAGAEEQLNNYRKGIVVDREIKQLKEAILKMARENNLCQN